MSPSRGDGGEGDPAASQAIRAARAALRRLLGDVHVLDALPERSRLLAVDAELPVFSVLSTVLAEQHPQHQAPRQGHGAGGSPGGGEAMIQREARVRENSSVGSRPTVDAELPPVCGIIGPALPSNVLAEVCEFEVTDDSEKASRTRAWSNLVSKRENGDPADVNECQHPPMRREWTSPDDGWGMHLSSLPMQDLAKMPMGMPVTVGELAEFLAHACEDEPKDETANNPEPARWAEMVTPAKEQNSEPEAPQEGSPPANDMLDWSLSQWRAFRLKLSGAKREEAEDGGPESGARLCVEECPKGGGPVVVHQVPLAPPRPILCTDDPEASLLKAVELLLAYPELDALPIVSPTRCSVVAHLTLSYCLAFMLPRMRGSDLVPLCTVPVGAPADSGAVIRKFDAEAEKPEYWAEPRGEARQPTVVLLKSQTIRDLLAFFTRTHHSVVPVVEDSGNGVLGLLSRRDLLNYLDLAMQTARRVADFPDVPDSERVDFDVSTSIEDMLSALNRFRSPFMDEAGPVAGATVVFDKELTLKATILRLLTAENRKLLFVQDGPEVRQPKLMRIVAASDVWRLLIGACQENEEKAGPAPEAEDRGARKDG